MPSLITTYKHGAVARHQTTLEFQMIMMNFWKMFRSRSSIDIDHERHEQNPANKMREGGTKSPGDKVNLQDHPSVIEVFQSQGCNSCPPTNSLLLTKMENEDPNLLILDYHVTYWDYLGWKDPFGVRDADDYQRQYAHARGTTRVYTPQVVVNGITEGVGNSRSSLERLIESGERESNRRPSWLSFSETEGGIMITDSQNVSVSPLRQGSVLEVLYDPKSHDVSIPRGENTGRTLTQRNTVKSVKELGVWIAGQGPIKLPQRSTSDGLRCVLIVQEGKGGPIMGVHKVSS